MPIVFPAIFILMGCQAEGVRQNELVVEEAWKPHPTDDGRSKVALISNQYETAANEQIVIPFSANNISSPPSLHLSFIVKSRGHCRMTYEDTEILLNDQVIKTLDFREYEDEQTISIDIPLPMHVIRQGNNQLIIAMGACDYDVDTMQLNQTSLVF